ncbi:hypothetical protein CK203_032967 [Vitis vinifera]|uniref:Uncharacterized protein n=1 Tax=Vitis vinifera TaxID=29760 RepID=A0A438HVX1_VITVI|nr:hypothetical protein CK203_032967 [Vitis vinifera]
MDQINDRILVLSKGKPKEVIRHGQSREQGSERRFLQRQVPPSYVVDKPDMVSFEDDVHEIVARLLTDDKCSWHSGFLKDILEQMGCNKSIPTLWKDDKNCRIKAEKEDEKEEMKKKMK